MGVDHDRAVSKTLRDYKLYNTRDSNSSKTIYTRNSKHLLRDDRAYEDERCDLFPGINGNFIINNPNRSGIN